MNKIIYFLNDGSQKSESAIWEDMNSANHHAKEQLKWKKNIHMVRINPLNGDAPVNVIREEK